MFKLEELSLRNFKKHRKLDVSFKDGINVIVGDNGAGKSSVIRAIEFVNTGKSSLDKADLLTRGEGSGYVWEKFQLFGKTGTLERHLDTSKVILEYDGKKYLKSGEVSGIWDSLLQIDSHIFSNVIIAHQKQIPLLFNGVDSVREKIFHKIFMVPPTDKLRKIIWDKYITRCAPPLPEENVLEIQSRLIELASQLNPLRESLDLLTSTLLTDQQYRTILTHMSLLQQCAADLKLRPDIESSIADKLNQLASHNETLTELLLLAMPVEEIKQMADKRDALLSNKQVHALKQKDEGSWLALMSTQTLDSAQVQLIAEKEQYAILETDTTRVKVELLARQNEIAAHSATLTKFATLKGHSDCPTCKQSLLNVNAYLDGVRAQKEESESGYRVIMERHVVSSQALQASSLVISKLTSHIEKINALTSKLEGYGQVVFSQSELDSVEQDLAVQRKIIDGIKTENSTLELEQQRMKGLKQELDQLKVYSGESSIEEDLAQLSTVVELNQARVREKDAAQSQLSRLSAEMDMLQSRMERTQENKLANDKRTGYLSLLQQAYDVLHNSQFPRALTQSYSSLVEEELSLQLSNFKLPYRAKIGEAFKIQMVDEDGHIMPEVSGGEEMIVGICLRLALHTLFSQSFPLIIIDEGTTHLQEKNVKCYFDFLREIKSKSNIKQIIAIDHNDGIQSVADNIIHI